MSSIVHIYICFDVCWLGFTYMHTITQNDKWVFVMFMQNLPSPTTGAFASQALNWMNNSGDNQQLGMKLEEKTFSDFSFQPQTKPPTTTSSSTFQSSSSMVSNSVVCFTSYNSIITYILDVQ